MLGPFELARAYTSAGISIIPVLPNEGAAPDISNTPFDCSEYVQRRIPTHVELREWFAGNGPFDLAVVLGRISGGLECLDLLYTAVAHIFRQLVTLQGGASLLEKLAGLRESAQGRTRFYYRCENPLSGLARTAVFELPSEPGAPVMQLVACVHGEGCWTALPRPRATRDGINSTYEWVGRDLAEVPVISEDERQLLLESAGCLNAWVDPGAIFAPVSPIGFEAQASWEQILMPLGWKKVKDFGEVSLWHGPERTRPGYCAVSGIGLGRDLLYMVRTGRAYTRFGAFVSLYFDGDVEKARSVRLRPTTPCRSEASRGRYGLNVVRKAQPLVSCITPTTGDRRRFLPQAIKCFQRQAYPNVELVIVCDGEDDLSDLIPQNDQRVHYLYLGCDRLTIGTKRNLACERAKGELIAHFDDDDWSHPDRLSFQIDKLLAEGAEVCNFSQLSFLELGTGVAWLCRTPPLLHPSLWHGLPAGNTFLYRRSYWSSSPFPDISLGEDRVFVKTGDSRNQSVLLSDYRLHVATVHSSNISNYSKKSSYWTPWPGDIREIMGNDLDFYLSLGQS